MAMKIKLKYPLPHDITCTVLVAYLQSEPVGHTPLPTNVALAQVTHILTHGETQSPYRRRCKPFERVDYVHVEAVQLIQ